MLDNLKTRLPKKVQVAIDFLTSYGIALLIVVIAIAIAYQISKNATNIFSDECTPVAGFSCGYFSINDNGILTLGLAQATGSAITVNGIACSTAATSNGLPAYGNLYVTGNILYYPFGYFLNPVNISSGGLAVFNVYCYGPSGLYKTQTGSQFLGTVWLNYSIKNTNIKSTQEVATVALQSIVGGIIPLPVYSFTENGIPSADGTPGPGSGNYVSGNLIHLTANVLIGYILSSWSCSGSRCYSGTSTSVNFYITANTIETAHYLVAPVYSLTENAYPSSEGTVVSTPYGQAGGNYLVGNTITLSETPTSGYSFLSWSCSGSGCYSGTSSSPNIVIESNTIETADFGQLSGSQSYTSVGTDTFVTPTGTTTSTIYTITLAGSGANGGGSASDGVPDGGGGGGGYLKFTTSGYSAGTTMTFMVGGVGSGGAGNPTNVIATGMSGSAGGGSKGSAGSYSQSCGDSTASGGCIGYFYSYTGGAGGSGGTNSDSGSVTIITNSAGTSGTNGYGTNGGTCDSGTASGGCNGWASGTWNYGSGGNSIVGTGGSGGGTDGSPGPSNGNLYGGGGAGGGKSGANGEALISWVP